ncbi:uncharacterized protein Tsen34 [Diabrotica undecimpunctata]|uniref:uncharacterized protein Tsen34 n=1 Tax=Diabrotica undecimpunctata TaxID=50387 RepID=UPI003B63ABC4
MINLYLSNGEILLYNINDWLVLRKDHRIIGETVGNAVNIPSLPIKIIPEEACLLISRNIVTLSEAPKEIVKTEEDQCNIEKYESKLLESQIVNYRETRKLQIEQIVDQVIIKHNDNRSREEIINEKLAQSPPITKSNMIWPIQLSASSSMDQTVKLLNVENILTLTTVLKRSVYADLWNRGYYVTQGHKFGGDFLVYLGDPVCHHAIFIVKCINNMKDIFPLELISLGRLGTSVKKRAVLASMENDKISYITMSWIDEELSTVEDINEDD